jgi:hypothetical protein
MRQGGREIHTTLQCGGHTGQVAPRALAAGIVIAIALAGCGDGGGEEGGGQARIAGDADPGDVAVIKGWVDTLRRGDVEGAAAYFAIPSVAENGPFLVRIRSIDDARRFNASLPCGARLLRAQTQGAFTTATFRLTERPGPGTCGPGTGEIAKTAFVIHRERIAEWRRVGAGGGGEEAPSQSA